MTSDRAPSQRHRRLDGRVGDLLSVLAPALVVGGGLAVGVALVIGTDDAAAAPAAATVVAAALLTSLACLWVTRRRHARSSSALTDEIGRLERVATHDAERRSFESELDGALDQCSDEPAVHEVVRSALTRINAERPAELHTLDPGSAELVLVCTTGVPEPVPPITSAPRESLAIKSGKTLVYESTKRLDACPHLRSRVNEPCSAVCVPLPSNNGAIGVLYATGPHGARPTATAIETMEYLVARVAARISLIRALSVERSPVAESDPLPVDLDLSDRNGSATDALSEPAPEPAPTEPRNDAPEPEPVVDTRTDSAGEKPEPAITDPVTNLPVHEWLYKQIADLFDHSQPFSVAILDLDDLREYEDRHGAPARDEAVRLLASVTEHSLRPGDHVGRIALDQLLVVFDGISAETAANAIERIRESLIISQVTQTMPAFRCSFGVAAEDQGGTAEAVVEAAQNAAAEARRIGGNRVVVAGDPQRRRRMPDVD